MDYRHSTNTVPIDSMFLVNMLLLASLCYDSIISLPSHFPWAPALCISCTLSPSPAEFANLTCLREGLYLQEVIEPWPDFHPSFTSGKNHLFYKTKLLQVTLSSFPRVPPPLTHCQDFTALPSSCTYVLSSQPPHLLYETIGSILHAPTQVTCDNFSAIALFCLKLSKETSFQ